MRRLRGPFCFAITNTRVTVGRSGVVAASTEPRSRQPRASTRIERHGARMSGARFGEPDGKAGRNTGGEYGRERPGGIKREEEKIDQMQMPGPAAPGAAGKPQHATGHGKNAIEKRDKSVGRILYAGRTRRAIIPLGAALLPRSSHLPACWSEPPSGPKPTHAYLMLLRIEVAAFHPATPRPVAGPRGTEVAVPVHAMGMPAPQTRLCGPVPRPAALVRRRSPGGR